MENVLRFYKRSNSLQECEDLSYKLLHLQKERKTYIDNLDDFYCSDLYFLISQKLNSAKDFFEAAPKDTISLKAYAYMEERLYQAVNDPVHLCIALSRNPHLGFQNFVNSPIWLEINESKHGIFHFCDTSTVSGKDQRRGIKSPFDGVFAAYRNPAAHANLVCTKREAIEQILLTSQLMYILDRPYLKSCPSK